MNLGPHSKRQTEVDRLSCDGHVVETHRCRDHGDIVPMRGAIANPERPRPIGGECVYPEAPTCRQDIPVPGDVATRHDPGQTGNVWDGEGP